MNATEFTVRAWLAQLTRQTGQRLTWDQRDGVHMIRRDGVPIGSMTSLASVENFLRGYERALESSPVVDATDTHGELDQAA